MSPSQATPIESDLSLSQILQEVENRWLRPVEVCEILMNHGKLKIECETPQQPPAGSFFLFDRKAVRYFRKDGYKWSKRRDGKTIKEAHERLKVGSKEVLHCYYAHGEENESFQRRCYWLLDRDLDHIVFVHYRNIKEPNKKWGVPCPSGTSEAICPVLEPSPSNISVDCNVSPSLDTTDLALPTHRAKLDGDVKHSLLLSSTLNDADESLCHGYCGNIEAQLDSYALTGLKSSKEGIVGKQESQEQSMENFNLALWNETYQEVKELETMGSVGYESHGTFLPGPISHVQTDSLREKSGVALATGTKSMQQVGIDGPLPSQELDFLSQRENPKFHATQEQSGASESSDGASWQCEIRKASNLHDNSNYRGTSINCHVFQDLQVKNAAEQGQKHLEKNDSFGRWISEEIVAGIGEGSLLLNSGASAYWSINEAPQAIQLDLSFFPKEELFRIIDFSPDHALVNKETKILIVGAFLSTVEDMGKHKWTCMFGDMEVPAELICSGVFRTTAPPHVSGKVSLLLKCDGVSCSKGREFMYHENSLLAGDSGVVCGDVLLQIRLASLLSFLSCREPSKALSAKYESGTEGMEVEDFCTLHSILDAKDLLVEEFLVEKLNHLLMNNMLEGGSSMLDKHGLGILHMSAALGCDQIILTLLCSGLNIDFRDARGWTALHWAAYCGREKTVALLLAAHANPGAKTDPTPLSPAGQTPADLAASCKHKGIAGYLAECSLTNHLEALNIQGFRATNLLADKGSHKAVQGMSERTSVQLCPGRHSSNDELSLQDSLAAVRNAAQAASRIHETFRSLSFCKRQEAHQGEEDEYGISTGQMQMILSARKNHRPVLGERDIQSAAIRIQQAYRGWKGRKDFLHFRHNVVKIQAHVRGHQLRKHYKHILWSVGVLEKAILRWRRRGRGFRGLSTEIPLADAIHEDDDFLKAGREQSEVGVEKALARVQSMVKHTEARHQYRRLLDNFQEAKAFLDNVYRDKSNSLFK